MRQELIMSHVRRARGLLALAVTASIALLARPIAQSGQAAAPADLRAMLEGTWQLDEWHVDGTVLRPPQIDGRWSNHDGVVLVVYGRRDTGLTTSGFGTYRITPDTWSYQYARNVTSTAPAGAQATVTATDQGPVRSFKIVRTPGKIVLEGAGGDSREYDDTFFTLMQNGKIVRRWRKVVP
jgi:hypothetical protein